MGTKTATGTAQSTPVRAACAALLWEACRRETDVEAVAAAVPGLRAGVAAGFDPEALVRAAVDHGVGQLMWRALTAAGCEDVLGDAGALLDAAAEVHRFEALLLLPRAVAHAVGPLVDAGLEPVVFKGPAVASRYPEPGLRHMEDIDLLLPKRSHRAALTALTRSGWDVVRGAAGDRYDTVLRHPDVSPLVLELHYGLEAWYEKTTRLDAEQLWRRRVEADILGTAAFVLPVEDELVALAAHAGKPFHGFRRLVWIADLAMCVGAAAASSAPVDWDAVHELARRSRCATVVSVALAMAGPIG
ncbi:MAG TPA: nucleotidyltransferase family protein, partial [Acidimicrobiales bacterium]|nr:nucleotidyltransferase family protein [Acidimicrobiales bacterium]